MAVLQSRTTPAPAVIVCWAVLVLAAVFLVGCWWGERYGR